MNLIGRGYPYPRRDFRWCTGRLKIDASNRFIHEFDDSLPKIYEKVTGEKYSDGTISKNKYFGAPEAELLNTVCTELYPDEQLLTEMQRALLDIEAKAAAISSKRNVILNFEKEIKKAFYKNESEAEKIAETRAHRISGITSETIPDDLVD